MMLMFHFSIEAKEEDHLFLKYCAYMPSLWLTASNVQLNWKRWWSMLCSKAYDCYPVAFKMSSSFKCSWMLIQPYTKHLICLQWYPNLKKYNQCVWHPIFEGPLKGYLKTFCWYQLVNSMIVHHMWKDTWN